jgi:lipoprotein-anchoring transpeptidase ErfK/SrfK
MSQSPINRFMNRVAVAALIAGAVFASAPAQAEPLALAHPDRLHLQGFPNSPISEDQSSAELNADLRRQIVNYSSHEAPGTIIIDTASTHLYLVLGGDKAIRYGIGVGREGFTWQGVRTIERKVEWPDWFPPAEMLARQPYLPRFVAGGPGNPLGARALYLSGTVYRIHGTNDPSTIGKHVSSGCIRMLNSDVSDLYARVNVGTKVIVQGENKSRNVLAEEQSKSGTENQRSPLRAKTLTLVNDVRVRGLN